MKQLTEIIDRIDSDGGRIYVQDGRLKLRVRSGLLSDQDKQYLTDHRDVLLSHLGGVDTNTIQQNPWKTTILSTGTAENDQTADEDQAERQAVQWLETADPGEVSEALDQAVGELEQIVEMDRLGIDGWLSENAVDPIHCDGCGGLALDLWQDLRGGLHCVLHDPPRQAWKLRQHAERIRRRDRTRRQT